MVKLAVELVKGEVPAGDPRQTEQARVLEFSRQQPRVNWPMYASDGFGSLHSVLKADLERAAAAEGSTQLTKASDGFGSMSPAYENLVALGMNSLAESVAKGLQRTILLFRDFVGPAKDLTRIESVPIGDPTITGHVSLPGASRPAPVEVVTDPWQGRVGLSVLFPSRVAQAMRPPNAIVQGGVNALRPGMAMQIPKPMMVRF